MKIGIVVDSSCDLPKAYLDAFKINVIPMSIKEENVVIQDQRDEQSAINFNSQLKNNKTFYDAQSPTKEEIKKFFLEKLVVQYDYVLFITACSYRSKTYDNAIAATNSILHDYKKIREEAGVTGAFQFRVIDSQTVSVGQAIVVAEVVKQLKSGANALEATKTALKIAKQTQSYILPSDLYYLYEQAKRKGETSMNLVEYTLASALNIKPILLSHAGTTSVVSKPKGFEEGTKKLFDFVCEEIKSGLSSNHIALSFVGSKSKIKGFLGFDNFLKVAKEHGIELLVSKMSMTAIVNVGPDSFSIAFATKEVKPFTD